MKSRTLSVFLVFLLVFSMWGLAVPPSRANAAVTGVLILSDRDFAQVSGATQAKDYFSAPPPPLYAATSHSFVGVEVKDADLNIHTALVGSLLVPTVGTTPVEILGIGGVANYNLSLQPAPPAVKAVADLNGNGVVSDDIVVRTLQDGTAYGIGAANANTGAVTLGIATPALSPVSPNKVGPVPMAFVAPGGLPAQGLTTAMQNYAKLRVTVTLAAASSLGANGVQITGSTVNPVTLVETAGQTETLLANVAAAGANVATTANYFKPGATFSVNATAGNGTITIDELATIIATYQTDVVETLPNVSITSTSAAALGFSRTITLRETSPSGGIYRATVRLVQDTADPCFLPVAGADVAACEYAVGTGSTIGDALYWGGLLVKDGDTITANYSDASNALAVAAVATDTAKVDQTPPVLTLRTPTDKSSTNVGTVTFSVDVTDVGGGVDDTAIVSGVTPAATVFGGLPGAPAALSNVAKSPIANGFNFTVLATGVTDGRYDFNVTAAVKDLVGNAPLSSNAGLDKTVDFCGNIAVRGTAGNKFRVQVGTTKPVPLTAKTGVGGLTDPRVQEAGIRTYPDVADLGAIQYPNQPVNCSTYGKLTDDTNVNTVKVATVVGDPGHPTQKYITDVTKAGTNTSAIKVNFTTAAGTRVGLDKATVAAADFSVGGVTPSKVALGAGTGVVYLTMPKPMTTDQVPPLEIVSPVSDVAGNTLDPATMTDAEKTAGINKLAAALDGLGPVITVTADGLAAGLNVSGSRFSITVKSSEGLAGLLVVNICADANNNKQCEAAELVPPAAGMTSVTSTQFTGTWLVPAGQMKAARVVVMGFDAANNPGNAYADIELDTMVNNGVAPVVSPVHNQNVPSSNPWLTISFAAETNEYPVMYAGGPSDSHGKVTLTAATLDGVNILSNFATADSINYTMATSGLAVGTHTWEIAFKDEAGNTSTAGVAGITKFTFAVIRKPAIEIALGPGWNLVSVPAPLDDPSIGSVFAGMTTVQRVYGFDPAVGWQLSTYDAATKKWSGSLVEIRDGRGYWVYSIGAAPIKVYAAERQPTTPLPQYDLKAGWNLIGFTSLSLDANLPVNSYLASLGAGAAQKWTTLISFSPNPMIAYQSAKGNTIFSVAFDTVDVDPTAAVVLNAAVMQGKGYWIYLTADAVLVP